jgi:hypothetical protein
MASSSLELFSKRSHKPLTWLSNSTRLPLAHHCEGESIQLAQVSRSGSSCRKNATHRRIPLEKEVLRGRKSAKFVEAHGGHERHLRTGQRLPINFAIANCYRITLAKHEQPKAVYPIGHLPNQS